jgi:hypothetical protein
MDCSSSFSCLLQLIIIIVLAITPVCECIGDMFRTRVLLQRSVIHQSTTHAKNVVDRRWDDERVRSWNMLGHARSAERPTWLEPGCY